MQTLLLHASLVLPLSLSAMQIPVMTASRLMPALLQTAMGHCQACSLAHCHDTATWRSQRYSSRQMLAHVLLATWALAHALSHWVRVQRSQMALPMPNAQQVGKEWQSSRPQQTQGRLQPSHRAMAVSLPFLTDPSAVWHKPARSMAMQLSSRNLQPHLAALEM